MYVQIKKDLTHISSNQCDTVIPSKYHLQRQIQYDRVQRKCGCQYFYGAKTENSQDQTT
jgi:hypothetical protein